MTSENSKQQPEIKKWVSQQTLADLSACSTRTIRDYAQRGVLTEDMKNAKGKYDVWKALPAITAYLRTIASGKGLDADAGGSTKSDGSEEDGEIIVPAIERALQQRASREKLEVERKIKEVQLEIARGDVISREDVAAAMAGVISNAKANIVAIPISVSTRIPGLMPKDLQIIKEECNKILGHLESDLPAVVDHTVKQAAMEQKA